MAMILMSMCPRPAGSWAAEDNAMPSGSADHVVRDFAAQYTRAFQQWHNQLSPNTRRAYSRAWASLTQFTNIPIYQLTSAELRDWLVHLQTQGLSPATIAQGLAAVSSFYQFTMTRFAILDEHGAERPLHTGSNPARAVRRPATSPYGKAAYLQAADLTRLLAAIPRDTWQGLRDYSLFLGYVLTGRRNNEWRTLRWGHLGFRGGDYTNCTEVYYRWDGKGKTDQLHQLPPPVWDAIQRFLKAANHLQAIEADHYIFTPLSDGAENFGHPVTALWSAPLSACQVNRLLRRYARRAGLDTTGLSVHTLRHSHAMLLDSLDVDLKTISQRLAHSSPVTTTIYLDHLKGVPDRTWRQAAAALKLDLL